MQNIALESNVRANLTALQGISKDLSITQERLATGKKVNNIIDNPTNFFAARSLNQRANDLTARLDDMGQAIQTINAATAGIDSVRNLIANMKAIVNDALANSDISARRELGDQYNTVMDQASLLAKDSGYAGVNLLNNNQKLNVEFGETNGQSTLAVKGLDVQGPNGNGVSEVTVREVEYRDSTPSSGSVASRTSQASVASVASAQSSGSTAAIASIASQTSVASQSVLASQGTSAGQASVGSVASSASQASVASQAGVASGASAGSTASVASQASFTSVAFAASAGSAGTVSQSYTQSYAFTMRVDANTQDGIVGIRKHSDSAPSGTNNGDHRVDFGSSDYLNTLRALTVELDNFDSALESQASRLATNLNIVTVRQEFSDDMINVLEGGADALVLADMNEEGANLLALQTRQSLAIQSLSLSSQQSQQVLRLLA